MKHKALLVIVVLAHICGAQTSQFLQRPKRSEVVVQLNDLLYETGLQPFVGQLQEASIDMVTELHIILERLVVTEGSTLEKAKPIFAKLAADLKNDETADPFESLRHAIDALNAIQLEFSTYNRQNNSLLQNIGRGIAWFCKGFVKNTHQVVGRTQQAINQLNYNIANF